MSSSSITKTRLCPRLDATGCRPTMPVLNGSSAFWGRAQGLILFPEWQPWICQTDSCAGLKQPNSCSSCGEITMSLDWQNKGFSGPLSLETTNKHTVHTIRDELQSETTLSLAILLHFFKKDKVHFIKLCQLMGVEQHRPTFMVCTRVTEVFPSLEGRGQRLTFQRSLGGECLVNRNTGGFNR